MPEVDNYFYTGFYQIKFKFTCFEIKDLKVSLLKFSFFVTILILSHFVISDDRIYFKTLNAKIPEIQNVNDFYVFHSLKSTKSS